jgi:ABC-type branched-subunit amino acid transport system ATPase component
LPKQTAHRDLKGSQVEIDQDQFEVVEQRADYIPAAQLIDGTATADLLNRVHHALMAKGTTLIVGPRGCGKTHMMRYTSVVCQDSKDLPFCVYVSFNRYYRLEPLTKARSNAIDLFHAWVLARIVLGVNETLSSITFPSLFQQQSLNLLEFPAPRYQSLVDKLERGLGLDDQEEEVFNSLSIERLKVLIDSAAHASGRKRSVLLLDDAALTLTPEYLQELFDIIRSIKSPTIAPKASVYPGTTEYGPRFHATQEAQILSVWLSIDDPEYSEVMGAIARQRYPEFDKIPPDASEYLKFASFGIPRAYLMMLHQYRLSSERSQQSLNRIVEEHATARVEEYRSLALKAPRFATLIRKGEEVFRTTVRALKDQNDVLENRNEKQLLIGISGAEPYPLIGRMLHLLMEAGLLFEHPKVSHGGPDRTYDRYTPHLAALLQVRAFSGKERGTSPRQVVEALKRRSTKHPLRRSLTSLIDKSELDALRLDLPPCAKCHTPRLSEGQRFCHQCGNELSDVSTFARCMSLSLTQVPGLTSWLRERIEEDLSQIKTIGDLLAHQDPGTELRKIKRVGQKRAAKVIDAVTIFVDEFLS